MRSRDGRDLSRSVRRYSSASLSSFPRTRHRLPHWVNRPGWIDLSTRNRASLCKPRLLIDRWHCRGRSVFSQALSRNLSGFALGFPLEWSWRYADSSLWLNFLGRQSHDQESTPEVTHIVAMSPRPRSESFLRKLYNFSLWLLRECWDIIALTIRGGEIILRLSPMIALTPASIVAQQYTSILYQRNHVSDFAWWYFTASMQALGPCFVKLCQWIATRRDMVPPHVCDRLSHLHDHGTPHSWKHTHTELTKAFANYREKGLEIHNVIGCGSAAQVYRAKLHQTTPEDGNQGKDLWVAVKVCVPELSVSLHCSIDKHICLTFISWISLFARSCTRDWIGWWNEICGS